MESGKVSENMKQQSGEVQLLLPGVLGKTLVVRLTPEGYEKFIKYTKKHPRIRDVLASMLLEGEAVQMFITKRTPEQITRDTLKHYDSVDRLD